MSDAAAAPAARTPKKRASKPKTPASHPKYSDMIAKAITALKERGGSSRQAILKYIVAHFKVGSNLNTVNAHLKSALKNGVKNGSLKQAKGTGAAGSFRLGDKKPAAKKAKKPKAAGEKKAKAKKPRAKKTGEKKAAKPKKPKSPKAKTAKAAKPKKPQTPKKAKAAKPKAAKKAKSPKKK